MADRPWRRLCFRCMTFHDHGQTHCHRTPTSEDRPMTYEPAHEAEAHDDAAAVRRYHETAVADAWDAYRRASALLDAPDWMPERVRIDRLHETADALAEYRIALDEAHAAGYML